jgi:nucleoside-diphosphate-sugar epimerase
MQHILVAGASRRVGFETVRLLRSEGYDVTCFFRSEAGRGPVEATGATAFVADAFDATQVHAAFEAAGPIEAVVCALGGKPGDEPRIDFLGARNCIDAAKKRGVARFLLVTAIGCGDTWEALDERAKSFLGPAIEAKNHAECYLFESGLDYTVLRPGGLSDDPATGQSFLTRDVGVLGAVTRADVAAQLVRCLGSPKTSLEVFQVLDRDRLRSDAPFTEVEV